MTLVGCIVEMLFDKEVATSEVHSPVYTLLYSQMYHVQPSAWSYRGHGGHGAICLSQAQPGSRTQAGSSLTSSEEVLMKGSQGVLTWGTKRCY